VTVLNAHTTKRSLTLFSAVAAVMSLLTAAAGPFAQTVRVVRVDSTSGQGQPLNTEYSLVFSALEERSQTQDTNTEKPQQDGGTSAKFVQPVSGFWDTASQMHAPLADVPAATALLVPVRIAVAATTAQAETFQAHSQIPMKSGRAPPLA
jgi:hypothetical protein